MLRYELLMLASPEITRDEEANLEKQLDTLINKAKGSILLFDRWGKYRLAYPVKGNNYGVYFLVKFEIEHKDVLKELDKVFYVKLGDLVMRHMVSSLEKDQPLEYKRPPSLEDTPKRHIGFLGEGELKHGPTSLDDKNAKKPRIKKMEEKQKESEEQVASSTSKEPVAESVENVSSSGDDSVAEDKV